MRCIERRLLNLINSASEVLRREATLLWLVLNLHFWHLSFWLTKSSCSCCCCCFADTFISSLCCRGKGDFFRLGHGSDVHAREPRIVEALKDKRIIDVAVGSLHCLAVTEEGEVRCTCCLRLRMSFIYELIRSWVFTSPSSIHESMQHPCAGLLVDCLLDLFAFYFNKDTVHVCVVDCVGKLFVQFWMLRYSTALYLYIGFCMGW